MPDQTVNSVSALQNSKDLKSEYKTDLETDGLRI